MGPELEKLSASMGDAAKVLKVNLDRNQPLAEAYGIRSVPTLMIFKEGKMLWKASGFHSKDQMQQALQPFLTDSKAFKGMVAFTAGSAFRIFTAVFT